MNAHTNEEMKKNAKINIINDDAYLIHYGMTLILMLQSSHLK